MIKIQVIGTDQVIAYLQSASRKQKVGVRRAMQKIGEKMLDAVHEELSGGMLQQKTGKLYRAQQLRLEEENDQLSLFLGFDKNEVPYGQYLLEGVPHDWLITAVNARALKFEIGGKTAFAKHVTHPPLPPRSFLAAAMEKVRSEIVPTIREEIRAE